MCISSTVNTTPFVNQLSYASTLLPKPNPKTPSLSKTLSKTLFMSIYPCFCFLASFLLLQALILFILRSSNSSNSSNTHSPTTNSQLLISNNVSSTHDAGKCPYGKVYVYDLPPLFNTELVLSTSCDDLHPWRWQCGIGTNDGYGKQAVELEGDLPEDLTSAWYRTNQFSMEIIFHYRLLNYKCRTPEPESATAYYIPFYAGLAVGKFLWSNDTAKRDWHCKKLLEWVQNQNYWRKSSGSDHFITLSRITWDFRRLSDPEKLWGSSFLNMAGMEKVTRYTIEKAPWDRHDISVPYPTGFHPQSKAQLKQWQRFVAERNRTSLFTFVGASRNGGAGGNDFRTFLLRYCYNESANCRVVDCGLTPCNNGSLAILQAQLGSEFCLQPKGDSFTRRAVFDCMVAGSVPVFFWNRTAYDQYQWFLPGEPASYSVFIDHEEVMNGKSVKEVLERYSKEEVKKMREKVIDTIPNIVYGKPVEGLESFSDAFDIAVEGVMQRIWEEKEFGIEEKERTTDYVQEGLSR